MEILLGTLDVAILALSVVVSVAIGLFFTNKNKSLNDYLFGERRFSVLPIALSLMTSCMSGISMIGMGAELYYQGPSYSFIAIGYLLSGPIAAYTVLPVFHHLGEISLYTYLERRFGLLIKYFVSIIFVLQSVMYHAIVLYVPSIALHSVLGIDKYYSILLIGSLCVLYSSIGGVKAVVWTDTLQGALTLVAMLAVFVVGALDAGGLAALWRDAREGGRLDLDGLLNVDLVTRHTVLGLFANMIMHVYSVGVNQVQVQRALSLPTLKQSQQSLVVCSILAFAFNVLASLLGLVCYSAYKACDPYLDGRITRRDALVVHYVATRFAQIPGVRGFFIAGLLSATLSSLSSYSNSMAALALEDYIKPARRQLAMPELSSRAATGLAMLMTSVFGCLSVMMAYAVNSSQSRLTQLNSTLTGALGVPFLAAFMLGVYTKFVNSTGILISFLVSFSFGLYVALHQTFYEPPLKPKMFVFYDAHQCAPLFDRSLPARPNGTHFSVVHFEQLPAPMAPATNPPFSLVHISYLTLPLVQFVLTILVAVVVSTLTGGCWQEIEDKLLAGYDATSWDEKDDCDYEKHAHAGLGLSRNSHLEDELKFGIDSETKRKRKLAIIELVGGPANRGERSSEPG